MTHMIGLICAATVCGNLPLVLQKLLDNEGQNSFLKAVVHLLYWSQFSLDFVIYAASNKQYREAYLLFLKEARLKCLCCTVAAGPLSSSGGTSDQIQLREQRAIKMTD